MSGKQCYRGCSQHGYTRIAKETFNSESKFLCCANVSSMNLREEDEESIEALEMWIGERWQEYVGMNEEVLRRTGEEWAT